MLGCESSISRGPQLKSQPQRWGRGGGGGFKIQVCDTPKCPLKLEQLDPPWPPFLFNCCTALSFAGVGNGWEIAIT